MQKNMKNMYKHQQISISDKTKIPVWVYDRGPQFHSLFFPGRKPSCIQTAVEDFWMIPKEFISQYKSR